MGDARTECGEPDTETGDNMIHTQTIRRRMRTQSMQRMWLLGAILVLATLISAGTVYIQRTPSLSSRAMFAAAESTFLASELAEVTAPPHSGLNAKSVPVLTYHRIVSDTDDINNVTKSLFKDQMIALKRGGWQTVTLQEFEEYIEGKRTLPDKSFVLTFDDGARDSFYPVDSLLKGLGFHAVNFIIVESSKIPRTSYYLNPREIERMLGTGRWSIGSHSYDGHRGFPVNAQGNTGIFFADRLWITAENRLETDEEFKRRVNSDLVRAKSELESTYDVPIRSFAFPLGNETGINGANNFAEGSLLTELEARTIYDFGYLQLNNQRFTGNVPRIGDMERPILTDDFLIYRVHVDHDWDGKRVLEILENSREKSIPFEDDFSTNKGWIPSWGSMEIGRNNLQLTSNPDTTSASVFLDGTALWDSYSFDAAVNWQSGHVLILGDVVHAGNYRACVYSPGVVRIQQTIDGITSTLKEKSVPEIAYGESVSVGMRTRGAVTECAWNFASVAEDYSRGFTGGIGLQVWNETPGAAQLTVSSIIVRPNE